MGDKAQVYTGHLMKTFLRRRPAPLEAGLRLLARLIGRRALKPGDDAMSELISLKATARPRAGKGAARQARREGNVPAVIYGDQKTPETINLEYNALWKQVLKGQFTSTAFELDVEGKKHIVLARDVQLDPVRDIPLHVDFQRVGKDGIIRVAIPVHFVHEALSPGLKRGGVLNIVRHDIEVFCPYDKIPQFFEVSLEGLEIGRSIHVSALKLPEGVSPVIKNRDFTIATIAGALKGEEETTTAAATPETGAAAAPAADAKGAAPAAGAKAPAAGGKAPAAAGKAAAAPAKAAAPAAKPAGKK
jgi:large subunit ribosomal protein L25